ncbi:MAG TPA: hypothetical protein VFI29_15420 [Hanamia sp.]|nr:hypothetical protein [Hanamia sp.]
MRDEENDIRIREAADNYHPAYDDTAWDKMEKLLDEHLPQKKRRRKIFSFLPFLLLLGGLILFIVWSNRRNYSSEPSDISLQETQSGKLNDTNQFPDKLSGQSINNPLNKQKIPEKSKAGSPIILSNTNTSKIKTNQAPYFSMNSNGNRKYNFKEKLPVQSNVLLKQESNAEDNYKNKITINTKPNSSIPARGELLNKNNNNISEKNENKTDSAKTSNQSVANKPQIKKQDTIAKSEITKKKTKNTNRFTNNFGITFSAGPSISSVHINNAGKISAIYGAGLSYSISKKFTIRTGFYKSKKIYSVGRYDYHFPYGSGSNYDNLQSIDANCNVDEIPLNLYYNFGKKGNHNWFVSTGLSSYLMKKESYEYYYKTITGGIYSNDMTIKNKNKNLFSVLNLSTGYQYNFNKKFFIMAEPYINLPLSGIGAGKVKLNSGGILFTITMKPFLKNSK